MTLQEDCYDTLETQQHIHQLWHKERNTLIARSFWSDAQKKEYALQHLSAVVDDEYSSEEVGIIALECPFRHYHPEFDYTHVELKDLSSAGSSGLATVYCTDFMCRTMPFIRYDHGDIVSVAGNDSSLCKCGQHGRTIERIDGRKDDCLKTLSGHYVPTAVVTNTLDSFFNADPNVSAFRLIQRATLTDFIFMYTGASTEQLSPALAAFQEQLQVLLKVSIHLKIERVDALPDTPSYKRKKVISQAQEAAQ